MAISANIHEKCLPAISSDIDRCGAVSLCSIQLATAADENSIFGDGSEATPWTMNEILYSVDYEAKACQIRENSLHDIISSNVTMKPGRFSLEPTAKDLINIKPFLNVYRNGIINNKRWIASGGTASGDNWQIDLRATTGTNIPADTRWFPAGMRVFIEGRTSGGTETQTAWQVVSASNPTATSIRLILSSKNLNSHLSDAELTSPVKGVLTRGLPNIRDEEVWCATDPGLNTRQMTPVWHETNRLSLCFDELYEQRSRLLRANNPRFREFGDIQTLQRNQQALENYRDSEVNQWFFGKAEPNQDMTNWQSLEQIEYPADAVLANPFEGRCVGYRASNIGYYEQLAECGRIFQAQGRRLNLFDLMKHLYQIKRQRQQNGGTVKRIEIFVDSFFRYQIQLGIIAMVNQVSGGAARYNFNIVALNQNHMGFDFDVYRFSYPGVEVAFLSHEFFDDRVSANIDATIDSATAAKRWMWILDFADIKTLILATNRVTNSSGTVQEQSKVSTDAMCKMTVPKQTWEHTSKTWTSYLECPARSSIHVGLSPAQPVYEEDSGGTNEYGGTNAYYDYDDPQ